MMMNDYFLKILMKQRHAGIMAEFSASRLSRLERPRMTRRINLILRSFLPNQKIPLVNQAPAVDERNSA
jgi:hypothetical protein